MAAKNQYELTYIISGVAKQNQIEDTVKRVNQVIEDNEGEILGVDEWGNQRLAYEIDRKRSGYYVNMYFKAPGELIPRLERQMEINDDILRYLTLRMDAKMVRHYETSKKQRAQRAAAEAEAAEANGQEDDGDDE